MNKKDRRSEFFLSITPRNQWIGFLQKFIAAGIFFILFLPIIGDYGDYLYPVGRELIFRSIIEIIFVAYVFLTILDRKFLPKCSPLFFSIIGFWLISGLATLFSLQPKLSFWGDFYRGLGFFTLSHFIIFSIIINSVIKTWERWKNFIYFAIFVSIPVVMLAIILRLIQSGRALSTLNNPVFLGAYILLVFFITFIFGWIQRNKTLKFTLFTLASLQVLVLIITASRGALVGLLAGIAAFFVFSPSSIKRKKIWLIALIAGLLIFDGIFLGAHALQIREFRIFLEKIPFFNRLVEAPGTLFAGRLQPWQISISAIKERPLLGFGGDNFTIPFDKYYRPEIQEFDLFGSWYDRAHNFIFDIGVTTGLMGLVSYFSVWAIIFWMLACKKTRQSAALSPAYFPPNNDFIDYKLIKLGLFATFIAYIFQNLFNLDTIVSQIYIFFFWGLVNFLANSEKTIESAEKNTLSIQSFPKKIIAVSAIILIPLTIFSLKAYHINFIKGAVAHNKTEKMVAAGEYDKALAAYEKAVNDSWNYVRHTLRHKYASTLVSYAVIIQQNQPDKAKEFMKKALELLDDNSSTERYHFNRGWLLAGVTANSLIGLKDSGAKEKADYYFGKALEMSPGRPGLWVMWAKTDLRLGGNYKLAKERLEKAIALNSRLVEPYFFKGIAAIYDKKHDEAKTFFNFSQKVYANNDNANYNPESNEALQEKGKAYFEIGDFKNLAEIYEESLQKNPKNIQLWASLAMTYKETGSKEKARETLERAEKFFPGFLQAQAIKDFLKNL